MLDTDNEYNRLCNARLEASMLLNEYLIGTEGEVLFREYSDTIYSQAIYELDALYKQAIYDALSALKDNGIV